MNNYTLETYKFESGLKMNFEIPKSMNEAQKANEQAYATIIAFMQKNKIRVVENVRQGKCSIYFSLTNLKRCYMTLKKYNNKK